jgi:putative ABC transport system substrate-binding protein
LELLREIVPGLSRVAILWNPDIRGAVLDYKETENAARALHLQLQSVEVGRADELDRAFAAMTAGRAEALIVPGVNPVVFANRSDVVRLAQRNRLPAMYGVRDLVDAGGLIAYGPNPADQWRRAATYVDKILKGAWRLAELAGRSRLPTVYLLREHVEAGGLMAYGVDLRDSFRRAAGYVDKILKGARPGDLPIERPTKFELAINLRAAKALGLAIPPSVLARADHLVE